MDIYNKIYEFCKVKNINGLAYNNGKEPTPRVNYITNLLDEVGIDYELDVFEDEFRRDNNYFNIIMKGDGTINRMVTAHHDIVNPNSDNANDNSCSVINAIALKMQIPSLHVVLLDGEEIGGKGSQRTSDLIKQDYFGTIDWILNLELTGTGGDKFFIGSNGGNINKHILELFDCPVISTPYNDSITFNRNGIDSTVINPCPSTEISEDDTRQSMSKFLEMYDKTIEELSDEEFSFLLKNINKNKMIFDGKYQLTKEHLYLCHSMEDSLDKICTDDMKKFVENVLCRIVLN